jgi:DNA-binding XRE family transcriptional regulator
MEQLAAAIGISRSAVSRFFAGRATSLTVALAVLDKLKLKFEEVFTQSIWTPPDRGRGGTADARGLKPPEM